MRLVGEWVYDARYDPPAPVIDATLMEPRRTNVSALVDSGADLTVVTEDKAKESSLTERPPITVAFIRGPDYVGLAPIYRSKIRLRDTELLIALAVAPISEEAILGRDLLNRLIVSLNGPRRVISVFVSEESGQSKG